ncbi:glutathione S-transferase T3-like [Camellia sinensis]|uniref:glutathione S-transferase T3-like n=1 Tax=Camellia sinensis TaxID=4442 RepID=UPI0010355875|nr:glutathione S-transferase T3-like [Camellia sinensis]
MDSSGDPFFTNLLQEGSNLDNQFMKSQYLNQISQGAGQESQFSTKKESATKKSCSGNFSKKEDNLLISAWLNTSLDAVHGNEQKSKTFWRRVGEYFHEHKTFISERTDNSLMNRWLIIQLGTNKFCGYFAQIESMRESGVNEQDKGYFAAVSGLLCGCFCAEFGDVL